MDNIKDTNTPTQDITTPLTPEGMPIPIETKVESNGEIQLTKAEIENTIETIRPEENLKPQEEPKKDIEKPLENIPSIVTPPTNVVDKTAPDVPTHELRTEDNLSDNADKEEQKFIENVKTAHEHS